MPLLETRATAGVVQQVAGLLDGKEIHADTTLLTVTSPQVAADAERLGITRRIEASGALVLKGMCFYQSYAREMVGTPPVIW